MNVHSFIADSAADAVAQIKARLGPEAVVLNVRQLPPQGLSRLWQKARIEVLACLPEPEETHPLAELRQEIAELKQKLPATLERHPHTSAPGQGSSRIGRILENMGLLPLYTQMILDEIQATHGTATPASVVEQLALIRSTLLRFWRVPVEPAGDAAAKPVHVLLGAPGVGKTTSLCKWLTQTVLLEGRSALVWRLDGRTANTAESVSVYGEILGVPVLRSRNANPELDADVRFIDLPGINWTEPGALKEYSLLLNQFHAVQLHLVLNACYDPSLLLGQIKAFSALPLQDLIFTHLDEEYRWGKLWNFVLGTNHPIRYLSAGQNIPGEFFRATPEKIFSRQAASK